MKLLDFFKIFKRKTTASKSVLYCLGEECEMILVDWNRMELIDLRNRYQINNYLSYFWK